MVRRSGAISARSLIICRCCCYSSFSSALMLGGCGAWTGGEGNVLATRGIAAQFNGKRGGETDEEISAFSPRCCHTLCARGADHRPAEVQKRGYTCRAPARRE